MQTVQEYVAKHCLTMTAQPVPANPNMDLGKWSREAHHYFCEIQMGQDTLTTYFSMGSGLKLHPGVDEVLDCLAQDARGVESADFEDWAEEYCLDTDSRKAEETYNLYRREARRLKTFLGPMTYRELLYETESL